MTAAPFPAPNRSRVEGIEWPSLPGVEAMNLLALQYMLDRTQWWRPERLQEHQFGQLENLLIHAIKTVPYYRDRLRGAGLRPGKSAPGGPWLTPERWRTIPLLTRSAIQQYGRLGLLLSEAVPPNHGRPADNTTSGSTGTPVMTQQTELTQVLYRAVTLRETRWHRRNLAGKLASMRRDTRSKAITPEGTRLADWGSPFSSVYPTGPLVFLDVFLDAGDQVKWLIREKPDYILTFPSNYLAIARFVQERGIRLPPVLGLRTVGEVVTPELRALCRAVWGVEIADIYSTQELGIIASQCPEEGSYHIQAEAVRVEILDEQGQACGPGQVGRVVLTPLHNFAMPLIRYAIGDYAEVGVPCPCGRGLPVLARILGRTRNMVTLPNGERRFAMMPGGTFAKVPAIIQHQVIQKTLEEIEVQLVVRGPLTPAQEDAIRADILDQLKHPFRIRFSYPTAISRSSEGKYEDFRSEV